MLFFDMVPADITPGMDLNDLMPQLDITPIHELLLFGAAALIAVYILWKGAKLIVRAYKGH